MKNKHIKKLLLCAMTMSITLSVSARVNDTTARVVVIVSGGAAVSPYTTPTKACKDAPPPAALYSAGTTDSFMREYLLGKGQRVFTSPATIGLGKVPEQSDHQFSNCPQALPDYMTVNSVGDIDLAGVHLANFITYLNKRYGIKQVDFVAHSMGGLYSRSAIKYLKQTNSPVKIKSLTTLGTPWQGTPFANGTSIKVPEGTVYIPCDNLDVICKILMEDFATRQTVPMVELQKTEMEALNIFNTGTLSKIPVTLIAGDQFNQPGGSPVIWPNDGVTNLSSALAEEVPDNVINHRQCYIFAGGTHSTWVSSKAHLPENLAITWNSTVGDWVNHAIVNANNALSEPNRQGCPSPI